MKILTNLLGLLKRSNEAGEGHFETRLKTLGKPQAPRRVGRQPRPVLFRRQTIAQ